MAGAIFNLQRGLNVPQDEDAFLDLSLDEDLQTCFIAIDRNKDPKAQKEILGSPFTVIGTRAGAAGRTPTTVTRPARICWAIGCANSR